MTEPDTDVVVVGAGLAGLAAAGALVEAGSDVVVLEASEGPGGRVRTDVVDGFRCDRGFQILLDAYPAARELLDYDRLDLRAFAPGALVRLDAGFQRIGDPLRRPADVWATLRADVGTFVDKLRVLKLRHDVRRGPVDSLWERPETTAMERLEEAGLSHSIIERFLGPLFTGITLDPDLGGSSQVLEFVFRMLSAGDAAVPARGMGEIAVQLAERLGPAIRYDAEVVARHGTTVTTAGGQVVSARAVIVATDASDAAALVGVPPRQWHGVTSIWLVAATPPIADPLIVLDGTGRGPLNNVAVMSNVSSEYAPIGRHLLVASAPDAHLDVVAARAQLAEWFGHDVDGWEELRVDRIERAQPARPPNVARAPLAPEAGVYVAGDHRYDASINGALASGLAAARACAQALMP